MDLVQPVAEAVSISITNGDPCMDTDLVDLVNFAFVALKGASTETHLNHFTVPPELLGSTAELAHLARFQETPRLPTEAPQMFREWVSKLRGTPCVTRPAYKKGTISLLRTLQVVLFDHEGLCGLEEETLSLFK